MACSRWPVSGRIHWSEIDSLIPLLLSTNVARPLTISNPDAVCPVRSAIPTKTLAWPVWSRLTLWMWNMSSAPVHELTSGKSSSNSTTVGASADAA